MRTATSNNFIMPTNHQDHRFTDRLGKIMAYITWFLVLGGLTLFFNNWLEKQHNPNQDVNSAITSEGVKEVQLTRNRAGHYVATGLLNTEPVDFLLDTGASDIALPTAIAQKLNLSKGQPIIYRTANGSVVGYMTTIKRVKLGDIEVFDVAAGINPGLEENFVLLGMSFLKQLEFTQRGKTLTIRQYPL